MPQVDIIIRSKNGKDMLFSLLGSIGRNTPSELYRLIVVDDGSEDQLIRDSGAVVDYYIRCGESHGAVTATNLGLGISLSLDDSKYVLVMDNDTEIPHGDDSWLERWITEMEAAPPKTAAMGATSSFVNPPQHILAAPQTYTANWSNGIKEQPPAVWFVSFAVLMRKDVVRQLGMWDEQYNPGNWEDTDYAVRMRGAGYEIRVAQSVYIHHKGHATFGDKMSELMSTNQMKFVDKWGPGTLWDFGIFSDDDMRQIIVQKQRLVQEASHGKN